MSDLGRGLQDLFFWQGADRMYLLSVSSRGAHYHWQRLPLNWNNDDFAFALPVDLSQMRPHRQADIRTLAAMSRSEKIVEALSRSRKFVGGQALSVLEAMISPQAIGYLLAIETAYAISLAFGVGELATGLLLVAGVVFVGQQVLVLIEELVAFVEGASDARTSADLDQAAKHMATALTLGLDIVVALLLRRRGRKAQGPDVVVRAKSGGAGGKRNSSAKAEIPSERATLPAKPRASKSSSKSKPQGSKKGDKSPKPDGSEQHPYPTSRQARREAMRKKKMPTSKQPTSQSKNESGREYGYDTDGPLGTKRKESVQEQTMDRSHEGKPHWEAGPDKIDPETGEVSKNTHGRPKLKNKKGKAHYEPNPKK